MMLTGREIVLQKRELNQLVGIFMRAEFRSLEIKSLQEGLFSIPYL